jgi:hypothetical protein
MMLDGLKVVTSEFLPGRWQFPYDRFVEYEPKDEWWCRKYGFGREVFDAVRIGDTLVVHPKMLSEINKAVKESNE